MLLELHLKSADFRFGTSPHKIINSPVSLSPSKYIHIQQQCHPHYASYNGVPRYRIATEYKLTCSKSGTVRTPSPSSRPILIVCDSNPHQKTKTTLHIHPACHTIRRKRFPPTNHIASPSLPRDKRCAEHISMESIESEAIKCGRGRGWKTGRLQV